MAEKVLDLVGLRFNRLIVIARAGKSRTGASRFLCVCNCGKETTVNGSNLVSGDTGSCGCLHRETVTKHGHSPKYSMTPTYSCWHGLRDRCQNPRNRNYANYGGRGIKVCARWAESFVAFLEDMGERPEGMSLDRIDNNGNYEPSNCRWADKITQCNNTRSNRFLEFGGRRQTMTQWGRELGIPVNTIKYRIDIGWPIEKALARPVSPLPRKPRTRLD